MAQLDLQVNKELVPAINKLIGALGKLEAKTEEGAAVSKTLSKALDPKVFEKFIDRLSKVDKEGQEAIKGIIGGINSIITTFDKLNLASARAVPALARLVSTLTRQKLNIPTGEDLVKFGESIAKFITELNKAGSIKPTTLKSIRAIADTVAAFTRVLTAPEVDASRFDDIVKLSGKIKEFFNTFSIGRRVLDRTALKNIEVVRKLLAEIGKIFRIDVDINRVNDVLNVFKIVQNEIINQILNNANRFRGGENQAESIAEVKKIINAMLDILNIRLDNFYTVFVLSKALKSFGGLFKQLGEIITVQQNFIDRVKASTTSDRAVDPFESFIKLLQGVANLQDAINRLPFAINIVAQISRVVKIGLLLGNIRQLLHGINRIAQDLRAEGGLEAVDLISRAIDRLGRGLRQILSSLELIPPITNPLKILSNMIKAEILVFQVGRVLKGLGRVAKDMAVAGSLDPFIAVSKVIANLGRGVNAIISASRVFAAFNPRAILKQFIQTGQLIGFVTRVIRGIAKAFKGLPNTTGDVFNAVSKFLLTLDQFFDVLQKIDPNTIDLKDVNRIAKIVNTIVKALRPLNRLKIDVSAVLNSIPSILRVFKELADSDFSVKNVNFTGMERLFKELVNGLNQLKYLDVSQEKLNSVAAIVKDLDKLPKQNVEVRQTGVRFGGNLVDAIEEGILRANFKQFLFRVFIGAFRALNPISLTKTVVSAISIIINSVLSLRKAVNSTVQGTIRSFKEFGNSLNDLGRNVREFGQNIEQRLGLSAIFKSGGFNAAVEFDALSSSVKTFGDLTEEETKRAQEFANQIGIDYPLSANEALEATLSLIKAGQDLDQIEFTLPNAADLAALSDTGDINTATGILITATNAFKDFTETTPATFENIATATNLISGAADVSRASVESLGEGLANVGPLAAQYGLSLSDTVSILATFSNASLDGAEAGTQLKSLLTNLGSDAAQAELKRLGVSLVDAEGNFRNLDDIIKDVNAALAETTTVSIPVANLTKEQSDRLAAAEKSYANATAQLIAYNDQLTLGSLDQETANKKIEEYTQIQQNANDVIVEVTGSQEQAGYITQEITKTQQENAKVVKTLFGSYGQVGGALLLAANGYGELQDQIETATPAQEKARQLLDNLRGDIIQFQGSVETLITKALLPLIDRVFRPLVQIGRKVVDFFLKLPDPILETIVNAGVLVSTLATLLAIGTTIVGVVLSFGGALVTVASVLALMATNVGLVVAGLTAFAGAFIIAVGAIAIFGTILLGISSAITHFVRLVENNVGGAGVAFENFKIKVGRTLEALGLVLNQVGGIFDKIFGSKSQENTEKSGKQIAAFFDGLTKSLNTVIQALRGAQILLTGFSNFLDIVGTDNQLKDTTKLFEDLSKNRFVQTLFGGKVDTARIKGLFVNVRNGLLSLERAARSFSESFSLIFQGDFGAARTKFLRGVSNILSGVSKLIQGFTGINLQESITAFDNGKLSQGVSVFVNSLFDKLRQFVKANAGGLKNLLTELIVAIAVPGQLVGKIARLLGLDNIAGAIESFFNEVKRVVSATIGTIFDLIGGKDLRKALEDNFGMGEGTAIADAFEEVGRTINELAGFVNDLFGALFPPGSGENKTFVETAFTGIADAFRFFNNVVLVPLRSVFPGVIELIRSFVGLVVTGFSNIFATISRIAEPIITAFQTILGGTVDFGTGVGLVLRALLDTFLNVLGELPGIIGAGISGIGGFIGSDFLIQLGEDISNGDFGAAILTTAQAFADLVINVIKSVPDLITGLGDLIGSPLLQQLGTDLKEGDFGGAALLIANAIADLLKRALKAVPNLITNIAELLGSPFLEKIGGMFQTGDFTGLIDLIANSIASLIRQAIGKVPELITNLGELLNLQSLIDLGQDLQESPFLAQVGTVLSGLATAPLQAIQDVVDAIKGLFDALEVAQIAPLTALAGLTAGLIAVAGYSGALGVIFGTLTGFISTALAAALPLLGVVAAFVLFTNVLKNLATLFEGDFGKFIADTFADITDTLAGFFGQDLDAEGLANQIQSNLALLPSIAQVGLRRLGDAIVDGIQYAGDNIALELTRVRVGTAQALPGGLAGSASAISFGEVDKLLNDFKSGLAATLNFGAIAAQVNPETQAVVSTLLRANADAIKTEFNRQLQTGELLALSAEDYRALGEVLVASNTFEDALITFANVDPLHLGEFVQGLVENTPPDILKQVDFSNVISNMNANIASRLLDPETGIQVALDLQKQGLLSQAQVDAFITQIEADLNSQLTAGQTPVEITITDGVITISGDTTPFYVDQTVKDGVQTAVDEAGVEITVPVKPEIETTTGTGAGFYDDVQGEIEEKSKSDPITFGVDLGDPETIEDTTTNLVALNDQTVLTQQTLIAFKAQVDLVTASINLANLATVGYGFNVTFQLGLANLAWITSGALIDNTVTDITENLIYVTESIQIFAEQSKGYIEDLLLVVTELKNGLISIQDTIPKINVDGGGSGSGEKPRAYGGPVRPNQTYLIHDRPDGGPEVMKTDDGKFYLLSGNRSGTIIPLVNSMAKNEVRPARRGGGMGNISFGDINVTIEGNAEPQVVQQIERVIETTRQKQAVDAEKIAKINGVI